MMLLHPPIPHPQEWLLPHPQFVADKSLIGEPPKKFIYALYYVVWPVNVSQK